MKSQKGLTLLKFVVMIIVLILIASVTVYVALQNDGVVNTQMRKIENSNKTVYEDNSSIAE